MADKSNGVPDVQWLVVVRDLCDLTQLGHASYCEVCECHAPKNQKGQLTGPVPHTDDCPVGRGLALLAEAKLRDSYS